MQIADVMTPCPYKIEASKGVDEALKVMDLRSISHLPVVGGDEVIGVVSKKDLEVAKHVCDSTSYCPTVGDICREDPYFVDSTTLLAEVTSAMAAKKTDYALVTDADGNFVGIFTTTDACRVVTLLLNEIG